MPTDLELASLLKAEDSSWALPAAPIVEVGRQWRRRRRGVALASLVAIAVLAVVVPVGLRHGRSTLEASGSIGATRLPSPDGELLPVGERRVVPAVAGTGIDGTQLSLAALRGEPVVIAVFGPWCEPCGAQAKTLEGIYSQNKYKTSGFLGVAVRDDPTAVKAFAKHHGETFPTIVADETTSTALATVGGTGVPQLLLVDHDGRLAAQVTGSLDPDALDRITDDLTHLRAETDDPTVNGLMLDAGALKVVPTPAGTKAGWGTASEALDQAMESLPQFTSTGAAPIISPVTVQLARVTLRDRPAYTDRLSWVVSFRTDDRNTFYSCELIVTNPPQPVDTSVHQGYVVVIQDASTGGDGVTYTERPSAPQCGASHSPLSVPQRRIAVDWTVLARRGNGANYGLNDTVTVGWQAPPCATFDGAGGSGSNSGTPFAVVVDEPLGPQCAGSTAHSTTVEGLGLHDTVYPPGPLGLNGRHVP